MRSSDTKSEVGSDLRLVGLVWIPSPKRCDERHKRKVANGLAKCIKVV
jgi:hypothetical protein